MNFDFKSTFIVNRTAAWFSFTAVISLLMKLLFEWSNPEDMTIFAEPAAFLLGAIFHTPIVHLTDGIALPGLYVTLDKYAIGANFFMMGFFLMACTIPHHLLRKGQSLLALTGVAFTGAFITVMVSVTRIVCMVSFQKIFYHTDTAMPLWFFRAESIAVYLFFLIVSVLVFKHTLLKFFRKLIRPKRMSYFINN
jgi:exosortase K